MLAFCSLLLQTYYSKNFAGKIGASLSANNQHITEQCMAAYYVKYTCTLFDKSLAKLSHLAHAIGYK